MTDRKLLSQKPIPPGERLIVALDVPSAEDAKSLVEYLGENVHFYKLGLELFMAGGYFELLKWIKDRGKKVFVDLKFFDVPQTVRSAVARLRGRGVYFTTVHGNDGILKAAVEEAEGEIHILAVTVLTSLDEGDIRDLGFDCSVEDLVLSRARRAIEIGCAGVISSGLEVRRLRQELGEGFVVVTPGIRPVKNVDDQKRTVDVREAFLNGADYIVVGRPIREAPDPREAVISIQKTIKELFCGKL
ncbi:MAG: orotidine-5'-phosphate decarboxylase [Syntrophales bacterium]|nr:orotidine-5'-phosphate decarboxylase [Syntrophales bacterium]